MCEFDSSRNSVGGPETSSLACHLNLPVVAVAVDRRWAAGEPRAKLGGGNGDCRIDKLTSVAGGGGMIDAQQVAEADCECGSATDDEKKVDERTKPTTATQKEEQIKTLVFQPNSLFLVVFFPSGKSSWPGCVVG